MNTSNLGAIIELTLREQMLTEVLGELDCVGVLLDLGCGARPFRYIYDPLCTKSIGVEHPDSPFEKSDIDIFCSISDLDQHLAADSVDTVLCAEVLHDIAEPHEFFDQVARVLKPGGVLILTTPFVQAICDGEFDHYRYTAHGLKYLCEKHDFQVCSISPVANMFATIIQMSAKPQLKLWSSVSKKLRLSLIYSLLNPFIFAFVFLPQFFYLACRRMARFLPWMARIGSRFNYGATGYVTTAILK